MGHGCGHEKTIVCMWIISNPFFSTPNDENTSQCMSSLPGGIKMNEWMNRSRLLSNTRRDSTFMGFSNSLKTEHTSSGELKNANACWQPNLNKFYTRSASADFCMLVNRSFFHPRNFSFRSFLYSPELKIQDGWTLSDDGRPGGRKNSQCQPRNTTQIELINVHSEFIFPFGAF